MSVLRSPGRGPPLRIRGSVLSAWSLLLFLLDSHGRHDRLLLAGGQRVLHGAGITEAGHAILPVFLDRRTGVLLRGAVRCRSCLLILAGESSSASGLPWGWGLS